MTIKEYKEKLNKHLHNGNRTELYRLCVEMVNEFGREGGIIAYNSLSDYYEDNSTIMSEDEENAVIDVLEALSGYCANYIGEGNYHLAKIS